MAQIKINKKYGQWCTTADVTTTTADVTTTTTMVYYYYITTTAITNMCINYLV